LLTKKPDRRYCNGAVLLEALKRELNAHTAHEAEGRRQGFGLSVQVAVATSAIMAAVLALSIAFITQRQIEAMEGVALTSGSSIVSFVASNAALAAAENMRLPSDQQDWLPAQAFVANAAADPNITQILVVDHAGLIRAASAENLIGAPYLAPTGRRVVRDRPDISVTRARTGDGENVLRFMRAIDYAGREVGRVEVSVRRTELEAASSLTTMLLIGLGLLIVAVAAGLAIGATQLVLKPLRRLRAALTDAAKGDCDFRISHNRRDELGQLFDAFNALVESLAARHELAANATAAHLDATTILAPANDALSLRDPGARHVVT
jgi:serine/threonine-protein kinase